MVSLMPSLSIVGGGPAELGHGFGGVDGVALVVVFAVGLMVERNPGALQRKYRYDLSVEMFGNFCAGVWLPAATSHIRAIIQLFSLYLQIIVIHIKV